MLLQIICFFFVLKPEWFGITDGTFPARLSFLLVGLWWVGFSQITFATLPKSIATPPSPKGGQDENSILTNGFIELKKVWHQAGQLPVLKRYLIAFFFYSMGVQTVMLAATLFGSQVLQMATSKLIICILLIQIVAIAGAYLMARLSDRFGNFNVLAFVVLLWISICVAAYFVTTEMQFYILASIVGLIMGGIQSLSRSTYAKIMPEGTLDTASFFSFYDVTEKVAIVIGMVSFGVVQEITGNMRNSILALLLFFVIGFVELLLTIKQKKQLIIATHIS